MTKPPALSVVVALQKGQPVERCLASLLAQEVPLQVVVVAACDVEMLPLLPAPHVVQRSASRSLPCLLGEGVASTDQALVAFTEAHCSVGSGWAVAAMEAIGSAAAAGGAVACADDLDALSRGLYYADYGAFLPPVTPLRTAELPGNNIVFRRDALPVDAGSGFWKTFHCRQLEARGAELRLVPGMEVVYGRRVSLAELVRRRYHHGRCFGGMRAGSSGVVRRFSLAAAAPLLPFLLAARVVRRVARRRSATRPPRSTWLWMMVAIVIWVAGEFVGNIRGSGASCGEL